MPGLPGSRVEVNGKKLYFECAGTGTPTVVLEAGFGDTSVVWDDVVDRIAQITRVCAYDRLALGDSDGFPLAPSTRTAPMQVDDLGLLLDRAGVDAPYVLVGHSWGGALARLFAAGHGTDTAGVVMIDSPTPFSEQALLAAMPPKRPSEDVRVTRQRDWLRRPRPPAENDERIDFGASRRQIEAADDLGDIPVIVVTAGRWEPEDLPPAVKRRLQETWVALGTTLAELSSRGIHVVASRSLHHVQTAVTGQPDVVVAAVRGVVEAARDDGRLQSCSELFGRLDNVECVR